MMPMEGMEECRYAADMLAVLLPHLRRDTKTITALGWEAEGTCKKSPIQLVGKSHSHHLGRLFSPIPIDPVE